MTLEIIAYIAVLVAFPFVVQISLMPVLFLADMFIKLIERWK